LLIRPYEPTDFDSVFAVINTAAVAYKNVIPSDRWHEPYLPDHELRSEIEAHVEFRIGEEKGVVIGVMGIQDRGEVALIRHAYVDPKSQRKGVGTALLHHAQNACYKPILIGTWKDADWAITFYERHGFSVIPQAKTAHLLRKYWNIPERQIETSVVLADSKWTALDRKSATESATR